MEIKQLKEFGKEVGLKLAQMNKMDEDSLILEIIRNVEPKVQYSKELVQWYNELDDSLFDQAEAEAGAESNDEAETDSGDVSIDDVIEVVEGYSKKADMLEILEDNDVAPLFEGFDASAYKLPTQLKKAMIDFLKNPPAAEPEVETGGDDQLDEIVGLINECENEDQLVEVFSEYQNVFEDMDVPDDIDEAQLQQLMLDHVASKQPEPDAEPEPEKDKPMTLQERLAAKKAKDEAKVEKKETKAKDKDKDNGFDWWNPDADGFDADAAFAEVEALKMPDLRKFAKHIGLSIGIGKKKDEILDLVATKVQEIIEGVGESTETGEVEITAELIADAVKAKDREALVEMCDQLGIALNALQKKSIPGMKSKLEEAIADKAPAEETKTTVKSRAKLGAKADASTPAADQSIYSIMEEMVLAGKSEDAIVKKVSPMYKEKGKSIIFIKKRVNGMIQVIKIDNDLE